jgi:hypothetical protein
MELRTVLGKPVTIPDPQHLVHLQFRRFAGCPICNLHLRSIVNRHDEILAAGIHEVVVFHSPADELRPHVEDLPFDAVADPDKRLYVQYGVESAPRSLLNPRAWAAIIRGSLSDIGPILRGKRPGPSRKPHGGRLGLPGDFLIDETGQILASKLGEHAYDQWSVDELLNHAQARTP